MVSFMKVLKYILLANLLFSVPLVGFAHSGRTDKNGCHAGTQSYHCHNASSSGESSSSSDAVILVGATVLVLGTFWYFNQHEKNKMGYQASHKKALVQGYAPIVEFLGSKSAETVSIGLRYHF